jgi:hypothetical protein
VELNIMPFNPGQFEAEVALKMIPTEQIPAVAQDAMEAGHDGPAVVRMAIIEPHYGWQIYQALPAMLAELGLSAIGARTAALRLARARAERILSAPQEDPLESIGYFYRLMLAADYLRDLVELAYLDDEFYLYGEDLGTQRAMAREEIESFLSRTRGEEPNLA